MLIPFAMVCYWTVGQLLALADQPVRRTIVGWLVAVGNIAAFGILLRVILSR